MAKTIQAWSPSLLQVYEECPRRAKFRAVDKVPEPERPPLPNGKEYPNERGQRIHDENEGYVRGQNAMPKEMADFAEDLIALRDAFEDDAVILEELWCFDEDWNIVPKIGEKHQWHKHWARIKIDAFVWLSDTRAVVIDYKTGKRVGNELKHGDQVALYAIASFILFEQLEEIEVELWYVDQSILTRQTYTREQAMRYLPRTERRGVKVTTDTSFEPDPSKHNCRFCPYKTGLIGKLGPEGTGHCDENLKVEK